MTEDKEVTSTQETTKQGPGAQLKTAREAAGLSQQDVAQKLF